MQIAHDIFCMLDIFWANLFEAIEAEGCSSMGEIELARFIGRTMWPCASYPNGCTAGIMIGINIEMSFVGQNGLRCWYAVNFHVLKISSCRPEDIYSVESANSRESLPSTGSSPSAVSREKMVSLKFPSMSVVMVPLRYRVPE